MDYVIAHYQVQKWQDAHTARFENNSDKVMVYFLTTSTHLPEQTETSHKYSGHLELNFDRKSFENDVGVWLWCHTYTIPASLLNQQEYIKTANWFLTATDNVRKWIWPLLLVLQVVSNFRPIVLHVVSLCNSPMIRDKSVTLVKWYLAKHKLPARIKICHSTTSSTIHPSSTTLGMNLEFKSEKVIRYNQLRDTALTHNCLTYLQHYKNNL